MSRPDVKITPFCFWETGCIGLDIKVDGLGRCLDLPIDIAEEFLEQLKKEISIFKQCEEESTLYFLLQKKD